MPRHKKRVRLPNGYGSISYLGKNRRRPYGVYPPARERDETGKTKHPKAIGYAETYNEAMEILVMYNKGLVLPDVHLIPKAGPTFAEIYKRYYDDKYNTGRVLSKQSQRSTQAAFKNCSALHQKEFSRIAFEDLQGVIDDCALKHSSVELIRSLFRGMYRYALKCGLVDKDISQYVEIKIPDDDEHGQPFTEEDITILWRHTDDAIVKRLLILIYSGLRITELSTVEVHMEPDWYFHGGIKTSAGKGRMVPIHSAVRGFVADLLDEGGLLKVNQGAFRSGIRERLTAYGITEDHTPHDCRHTFSALCEHYRVPENDRKRILGHAFTDVTNKVYGHRTLEELRESIELIRPPA